MAADDKQDEKQALQSLASGVHAPTPSGTLLPAPIASLVSLATRSSSVYLSIGSFIGGLAIDGARVTTLTGLELSRALVGSILLRAGKDVADRSSGDLGKAEAESLLEKSVCWPPVPLCPERTPGWTTEADVDILIDRCPSYDPDASLVLGLDQLSLLVRYPFLRVEPLPTCARRAGFHLRIHRIFPRYRIHHHSHPP